MTPSAEAPDIAGKIRQRATALSANDRKVAAFLVSRERDVVFGTAASVAHQVGVSKAAVIRFAARLGYAGFSELQDDLQRQVGPRLALPVAAYPRPSALARSRAFFERIRAGRAALREKQARLADFVLDDYDAVAFLTAAELARKAGVSEATVVRFVAALGYAGYPEFQRDVQEAVRERITLPERLDLAIAESTREDTLAGIIRRAIESLQRLADTAPSEQLEAAARLLVEARRVVAVGFRASASLALFFAYHLGKIHPAVQAVTSGGTTALEPLAAAGREDVVVGIAFPRYPRETVEVFDFAHRQGCQTLAVSDTLLSPLAKKAALSLLVPTEVAWFVTSHAAPSVLLTGLLAEVARLDRERAESRLEAFERFAAASALFHRDRLRRRSR